MSIGKSIRIYLDDGSISGIRHAEIVNWTGQAITLPRKQVNLLTTWNESTKPGVYFLFGVDEKTGELGVYIGEAENVFHRLKQHLNDSKKDFWNEVVFFTSKDENLTKSHVKYLESRLIQITISANRYSLLNGNEPKTPVLPRGDRDSMEEFIQNLRTLLGVLGHKTLEPLTTHVTNTPHSNNSSKDSVDDNATEFQLKIKGLSANALYTDEGIVVLKDSLASATITESLSSGYKKLRNQLIETKVLSDFKGKLVFTKDHLFTSPSQAAAIIAGYAMNGRTQWKTKEGNSLKNLEETTQYPKNIEKIIT